VGRKNALNYVGFTGMRSRKIQAQVFGKKVSRSRGKWKDAKVTETKKRTALREKTDGKKETNRYKKNPRLKKTRNLKRDTKTVGYYKGGPIRGGKRTQTVYTLSSPKGKRRLEWITQSKPETKGEF